MFNGYGVSGWGDENVLEMDSGAGGTTLGMCLNVLNGTELYAYPWLKFITCILLQ